MSKGNKRRPGDNEAFNQGYGTIFGHKKSVRGSFVYDPVSKSMIPKDEYVELVQASSPMIISDIQPYKSMATGEMIGGRAQHREHLRRHNLIEIGNETKYLKNERKQESPAGLRERIAQVAYDKLR